jgi:hypothetical protein
MGCLFSLAYRHPSMALVQMEGNEAETGGGGWRLAVGG